jgi:protein-tyrosine phosphatase
MAHAVFAHKVQLAGLGAVIEADSAGTGHWHLDEPPHRGTQRVLRDKGIVFEHRARLVRQSDLSEFDYVLAMDRSNLEDLLAMSPDGARIELFLQKYAPHASTDEVPDPYYTGRFDEVYALVDGACDALLTAIRKEHGL